MIGLVLFSANISTQAQNNESGIKAYLARPDSFGKAGDEAVDFAPEEIPIFCIVQLDRAEKDKVSIDFVAVEVAGVKPDLKIVTIVYLLKERETKVEFTGRPAKAWTPGKYRVDVFVNGKLRQTLPFTVKGKGGKNAVPILPAKKIRSSKRSR